MTDRQEIKLSMFIAVRNFINDNITELDRLPGLLTFSEQFSSLVDEVKSIRFKQRTKRKGISLSKAEIKNELIFQAYNMSRKLVAYAQLVGNSALKSEVGYSHSHLRNASASVLQDCC